MLTRRSFTLTAAAFAGSQVFARSPVPTSENGNHTVLMLNADCNDANLINVFEPPILHVAPGDTVTFVSTDAGHNTASKRGMLPDGAEPWNSIVNEDAPVTFDVPGVYGYVCVPHYEVGMVGLVVVGNDYSNLKSAKKVRQVGDARKAFRALFRELEAQRGQS